MAFLGDGPHMAVFNGSFYKQPISMVIGHSLASESRKIDQHVDAKGAPNLRATSQIVFSSLILHSFSSRQL